MGRSQPLLGVPPVEGTGVGECHQWGVGANAFLAPTGVGVEEELILSQACRKGYVDMEIVGTNGNDPLIGGSEDDIIRGLAGNDRLSGNEGTSNSTPEIIGILEGISPIDLNLANTNQFTFV